MDHSGRRGNDDVVTRQSDERLHDALFACVTGLPYSRTEGHRVEVLAAWIEDALNR